MESSDNPYSPPHARVEDGATANPIPGATAKTCPKCGLLNPPGASRCDCGYDFQSQSVEDSYLEKARGATIKGSALSPLTTGDIIVCIVFPFAGVIVGLVRAIRRKPGALQMLGWSLLVIVIAVAVCFGMS